MEFLQKMAVIGLLRSTDLPDARNCSFTSSCIRIISSVFANSSKMLLHACIFLQLKVVKFKCLYSTVFSFTVILLG